MEVSKRKLQEIKGSYFMTLPKSWVDNYKLKKGSEVSVVLKDQGSLEVFPEFTEEKEEKIALIAFDDHVIKRLSRAYFSGNDLIKIKIVKPISNEQRKNFIGFINKLMNVEIVEETSDRIVLQNFGYKHLDIGQSFKRMYFLTRAMFDDVINGIYSNLDERDEQVDKFYFLVVMQVRIYISKGYYVLPETISMIKALDYRIVAEKVERIGDILKGMKNVKKEQIEVCRKVFDYFNSVISCFITDDFEKSCEMNYAYDELRGKVSGFPQMKEILDYAKDISDLIK